MVWANETLTRNVALISHASVYPVLGLNGTNKDGKMSYIWGNIRI